MAQDAVDRITAERKAAFVKTMKNHPERLKGKSVEEAYQGMRRQVEHMRDASGGDRNSSKFIGPKVPKDKPSAGAVERRLKMGYGQSIKVPKPGMPKGFGGMDITPKISKPSMKSGYGVNPNKDLGNAVNKVKNAVTHRRGF